MDAETDQRGEWFDDTIQYLGERYPELTPSELSHLRTIGERYCAPPIPHGNTDALTIATEEEPASAEEADAQVPGVEPTSVVAVDAAESVAVEPADVELADVAVELAETALADIEVAEADVAVTETDTADADVAEPDEVSAA